jgi:hypothetical protein
VERKTVLYLDAKSEQWLRYIVSIRKEGMHKTTYSSVWKGKLRSQGEETVLKYATRFRAGRRTDHVSKDRADKHRRKSKRRNKRSNRKEKYVR